MINTQIHDLAAFRSDGRKFHELRGTVIELGVESAASGSCYLKQGMTEVMCIVKGPCEKKGGERQSGKEQLLDITYTVAPFSSIERREYTKFDREFSEFAENIRKSFEKLIFCEQYPKSTIHLIVTLIQNDGSSKSAILNCITLALINSGIAMRDFLISTTVGFRNTAILDITAEETYDTENQLILSFVHGRQHLDFIELREARVNADTLKKLVDLATQGCNSMYQRMKQALIENAYKQVLIK